jgi:transcriptional regulator with XRE-family HTH domain
MSEEQVKSEDIGHRLRVWRAQSRLSQHEVAKLVNTNQSAISRIEKGGFIKISLESKLTKIMSKTNDDNSKINEQLLQAIANSSEFRALIRKIARSL